MHDVRASMVERILERVVEMMVSQSCSAWIPCLVFAPGSWAEREVEEFRRWPTGTRTTSASFPSGAAVGSILDGTLT